MSGSSSVSITLEELPGRLHLLGPKIHRALVRGLRDGGNKLRAQVHVEIKQTDPYQPVDRGFYKAGWRKENTEAGCIVGNLLPYAQFIERGRLPGHGAPLEPIAEWVRRKKLYFHVLAEHYAAHSVIRESHDKEAVAVAERMDSIGRALKGGKGEYRKRNVTETRARLRKEMKRDVIESACREVAAAVILKMWREGIPAKYPLARAIMNAQSSMRESLREALAELQP